MKERNDDVPRVLPFGVPKDGDGRSKGIRFGDVEISVIALPRGLEIVIRRVPEPEDQRA